MHSCNTLNVMYNWYMEKSTDRISGKKCVSDEEKKNKILSVLHLFSSII